MSNIFEFCSKYPLSNYFHFNNRLKNKIKQRWINTALYISCAYEDRPQLTKLPFLSLVAWDFDQWNVSKSFSEGASNIGCPTSDLIFKMCSRIKLKHILFVLLLFHALKDGSGMFEWLFGKETAESSESDDSKEPITRFEVLSTDEKFLDFATALTDLSPLDACYHIVSV